MVEVGDRLSYSGELCTVRFIGEIPAWPGEVAFGVEWDSLTYGDEKTGSFVKSSKKHDGTRSFYEALVNTYGTSTEAKEIKIGSKVVEQFGFEKLQRLQSDFSYLKNISLSRKEINRINKEEIILIKEQLPNLEELDLSFNLFNSLESITTIISPLGISKFKLVGNELSKVGDAQICQNIKRLDISLTKPSQDVLSVIPNYFPNVDKLLLSDNKLDKVDNWISKLHTLEKLDLSLNNLQNLPSIISKTPIKSLNISDNQLFKFDNNIIYENIQILDIRRNDINDFDELDTLSIIFPNVIDIRINGNPVFIDQTPEEMEMNIISRFPNIKSVNGTEFSVEERTNAELYFISQASRDPKLITNSRVKQLAAKYEIKLETHVNPHIDNIQNQLIQLSLQTDDKTIKMNTLQTNEILKLKGQISRLFNLSYIDIQLSYKISQFETSINNDLSLISSHNFENGQIIYIKTSKY
ncbi:Tubulin-specific chaperone cofactor E-like protein [Wickerhamomyces ciferrii]|uniref:Tubulin-specific chaperone cofactor E-like protein n=1 Tax=Wickerhamomyces ciferrii (strain ATCC 14091 / BCRC 22168 / CBS 111 / JCM 3599 / NBRC 0793 / NRRL Y-1031 F-60-10) TaxID=1206466 RepID=K0KJB2_WICCF|nr:Tubulin-specific chaperone cofactor E-like protein [Wickerhamomyces ciferrii]CCH41579.1 Tubulin-specific chaperone cofactor E-like protein [Wickerhamomyces ciferrii]